MTTDAVVSAPKSPTSSEEQQEKFRLSIANWCLANEGLRKSIQSLQQPPPMSLCLSSESLASICSGRNSYCYGQDTQKIAKKTTLIALLSRPGMWPSYLS